MTEPRSYKDIVAKNSEAISSSDLKEKKKKSINNNIINITYIDKMINDKIKNKDLKEDSIHYYTKIFFQKNKNYINIKSTNICGADIDKISDDVIFLNFSLTKDKLDIIEKQYEDLFQELLRISTDADACFDEFLRNYKSASGESYVNKGIKINEFSVKNKNARNAKVDNLAKERIFMEKDFITLLVYSSMIKKYQDTFDKAKKKVHYFEKKIALHATIYKYLKNRIGELLDISLSKEYNKINNSLGKFNQDMNNKNLDQEEIIESLEKYLRDNFPESSSIDVNKPNIENQEKTNLRKKFIIENQEIIVYFQEQTILYLESFLQNSKDSIKQNVPSGEMFYINSKESSNSIMHQT